MKIMIILEGTDQCREFNIIRDITIAQLKNELSKIYNIPSNQMEILLNDSPLQNPQLISQIGIGNNLLSLRRISPNQNIINSNPNLNQSQALLRSNYNNLSNSNLNQNRINPNNSYINITPNNTPLANSNSFQTNPELLGLSSSEIINDAIAYNNLFGSNLDNIVNQRQME